MKEVKYITFRRRDGSLGVVEAMLLEDNSWILIDTYQDLHEGLGVETGYEGLGRVNIIGSYNEFEQIVNFLRLFCGNCEVTWV